MMRQDSRTFLRWSTCWKAACIIGFFTFIYLFFFNGLPIVRTTGHLSPDGEYSALMTVPATSMYGWLCKVRILDTDNDHEQYSVKVWSDDRGIRTGVFALQWADDSRAVNVLCSGKQVMTIFVEGDLVHNEISRSQKRIGTGNQSGGESEGRRDGENASG